MPLYTFYFCVADRGAPSFESHELPNDSSTFATAEKLLEEHGSCDRVEVWNDDRPILTVHRKTPHFRVVARDGVRQRA